MDRDVAKRIAEILLSCSGELDRSVSALQHQVDEDFFHSYRQKVGEIMGLLYIEVLREIYAEYPDLEPDSFQE